MNRSAAMMAWTLAAMTSCWLAADAFSQAPSKPRLVLKGYDPVAYFTEQKAVKGTPQFRKDFDGARYHFASEKNRDAFARDPDRYLPQFAGYCAGGVSVGERFEADPTLWKIVDGKLYVFASARSRDRAERDPAMLAKAREHWKAMK